MSCSTLTGLSMPCRVKQSINTSVLLLILVWRRRLTLEDLEVLQVCVFGIYIELDASHGNIEVDTVEDLAKRRAVSRLSTLEGKIVGEAYPVPHCSTLVIFSCSRLLSHATSSCLSARSVHFLLVTATVGLLTLIPPWLVEVRV